MQSPKLWQKSFTSVKAGCHYILWFGRCICWSMLIQCDRERIFWVFLHSLENERFDAAGAKAL